MFVLVFPFEFYSLKDRNASQAFKLYIETETDEIILGGGSVCV